MLCYLTGVSRWVGILEVVSAPFTDNTPIWTSGTFPSRVKVKPVFQLEPKTAVPVLDLKEKLSVFRNLSNPKIWSGAFRVAPLQWKKEDGEAVAIAVEKASRNPIERPTDEKKLNRKPKRY